jgi:exodeoxyribonuclease VII large subunit
MLPFDTPPSPPGAKAVSALTVSELTALIRELLEEAFDDVWVCGEISNYKEHMSGHVYFTLKDETAQIRCVMWRDAAKRLRFRVHDGLQVLVRGRVSVFPPRGDYQLYVREMQPRGLGPLELAFRQLYEKLQKLGLFAPERKRPLPRVPRRIGIVTSPRGAVIRDMLRILGRRWPLAEIWIRPVTVQGETAPAEIAEALRWFGRLSGVVDVVIVARGGGSAEDLWAFNEECVAFAIRACSENGVPVISAVGHEVDWTIADYAADKRAATPSEAAEMVVPDQQEMRQLLQTWKRRLEQALRSRVQNARRHLESFLRHPVFRRPLQRIKEKVQLVDDLGSQLHHAMQHFLSERKQQLALLTGRLHALSPLQVLQRGYSLTWKEGEKALLRSSDEVAVGDCLITQLARGCLRSRVESVQSPGDAHS